MLTTHWIAIFFFYCTACMCITALLLHCYPLVYSSKLFLSLRRDWRWYWFLTTAVLEILRWSRSGVRSSWGGMALIPPLDRILWHLWTEESWHTFLECVSKTKIGYSKVGIYSTSGGIREAACWMLSRIPFISMLRETRCSKRVYFWLVGGAFLFTKPNILVL